MLRKLLPALFLSFAALTAMPGCAADSAEGDDTVIPYEGDESELTEAPEEGEVISRLVQVSPTLWRGGQPGEEGIALLKSMGVKTIIDLRYAGWPDESREELDEEAALVQKAGLEYKRYSISAYRLIKDETIEDILAELRDPRNGTVFVHCKRGRDRTGLVIGLHRVLNQDWPREDAREEMLARGFRRRYVQMTAYFYAKTAGH